MVWQEGGQRGRPPALDSGAGLSSGQGVEFLHPSGCTGMKIASEVGQGRASQPHAHLPGSTFSLASPLRNEGWDCSVRCPHVWGGWPVGATRVEVEWQRDLHKVNLGRAGMYMKSG